MSAGLSVEVALLLFSQSGTAFESSTTVLLEGRMV
jgi:hypothetical protein